MNWKQNQEERSGSQDERRKAGNRAHTHIFNRIKPQSTVETCACGRFRFTEHAGPSIAEMPVTTGGTFEPQEGYAAIRSDNQDFTFYTEQEREHLARKQAEEDELWPTNGRR